MLDNMKYQDTSKVLVSIKCYAYNHEKFIRQCLDGFVMQKTTFRFEAVVHDDASTDGTAEIIREYAEKYPEIIVPVLETENQYSKHDGSLGRAMARAVSKDSKYYAFCEGDDYWIDPNKLQKQVDYLEAHPECTMCFGNAIEHWEDGSRPDKLFSTLEERDYFGEEFSEKWIIPTATIVVKRWVVSTPLYLKVLNSRKISAGDLPLCLTCAEEGTTHAFSDVFSVYRRTNQGFWLSLDAQGRIKMGDDRVELFRIFGRKYKNTTIPMAMYHYQRAWQLARDNQQIDLEKKALQRLLLLSIRFPYQASKRIIQILKERKNGNN